MSSCVVSAGPWMVPAPYSEDFTPLSPAVSPFSSTGSAINYATSPVPAPLTTATYATSPAPGPLPADDGCQTVHEYSPDRKAFTNLDKSFTNLDKSFTNLDSYKTNMDSYKVNMDYKTNMDSYKINLDSYKGVDNFKCAQPLDPYKQNLDYKSVQNMDYKCMDIDPYRCLDPYKSDQYYKPIDTYYKNGYDPYKIDNYKVNIDPYKPMDGYRSPPLEPFKDPYKDTYKIDPYKDGYYKYDGYTQAGYGGGSPYMAGPEDAGVPSIPPPLLTVSSSGMQVSPSTTYSIAEPTNNLAGTNSCMYNPWKAGLHSPTEAATVAESFHTTPCPDTYLTKREYEMTFALQVW